MPVTTKVTQSDTVCNTSTDVTIVIEQFRAILRNGDTKAWDALRRATDPAVLAAAVRAVNAGKRESGAA